MARAALLFASCALALTAQVPPPGSVLLLDRGLRPASVTLRVGWTTAPNVVVTDHFTIGQAGESWVIDKIRTWGAPGLQPGERAALGDLYQRIALYGGLESDTAPADQQAAAAVCACHGPTALAESELHPGTSAAGNPQVVLIPVSGPAAASQPHLWQLDFESLRWSVPGGSSVQFGVFAQGRAGRQPPPAWFSLASATGGKHAFRLFETGGKPVVPPAGSLPHDESLGIHIQVWGHLLVNVAIRPAGKALRVVLLGSPTFDVSKVDPASLRFGPQGAAPEGHGVGVFDRDAYPDLVLSVHAVESESTERVACLTGRRLDGVPFEGCDLLPAPRKRL